jgi:hypothetical protein
VISTAGKGVGDGVGEGMGVRVAGLLVDVAVGVVICVGVGEHADSATNIRTSRMISERFMLASILPQTGKTVPDLSDTKAAPLDREIILNPSLYTDLEGYHVRLP